MLLKIISPLVLVGLFILMAACSGADTEITPGPEPEEEKETVKLVYVDWVSEIASTHVVKTVIEERLGYHCELLSVTAVSMWESIAAGDQDAMVAAWLPSLQGRYYSRVKDDVFNLGSNLEGVEMGLVVPEYVAIDSIDELNDHVESFDGRIIGIDPEAGLMVETEQAVVKYGLEFDLIAGSDLTMATALEIALKEERWIVLTGWSPHWKFARWDLKYLKDPEGVYGDSEYIGTIVRRGLEEDMPEVYAFLKNFYWEPRDMEQVMLWFSEEEMSAEEAAKRWVDDNKELVDQWVGR